MRNIMHLVPAYGRQYQSTETMEKDFADGKDFKILAGDVRGTYASIRDLERLKRAGFEEVHVYTDIHLNLRKVYVL